MSEHQSELRPQNYKETRPAEYFEGLHERARTKDPGWTYELLRMVMTPIALFIYRTRQIEVDNVPASGPVILAPNHFSNMDHFLVGVWLRRKIRFMAKSQLFANKPAHYLFGTAGAFPVRRGQADEEAFRSVNASFDLGGCVLIYAEGGRSRSGKLERPRPGVGRAALESGVPVVPVAIHGSQAIRGWKRLAFPKVTVQYAEPISFERVESPTREQQIECSEEIFAHVREMHQTLEQEGRAGARRRAKERRAARAAAATS